MGKKLSFGLFIVLTAFILSKCGKESGTGGNDNPATSISYDFEENGCKTGKHSFENKQAFCEGLRSKQANKGCAYNTRKLTYEKECGGAFLETP